MTTLDPGMAARGQHDPIEEQNREKRHTWTSFSFSETRFTISRRACLSGLGLIEYASSRMSLSLVLSRRETLLATERAYWANWD